MKPKSHILPISSSLIFCAFASILPIASAANISWVGTTTGNWTTTTNWSDSLAPAAGNTYTVSGSTKTITNPDANSSTFAGDSLTVTNGAILRLYRTNGGGNLNVTSTIPSLTVDGATIKPASSAGSITQILANQVTLANAVIVEMNDSGGYTNQLTFNNGYTGTGTLTLQRSGTTGSTRTINIAGTNSTSGYSGNVTASGNINTDTLTLNINTASGWGTGSLTVNQWCTATYGAAITSTTSALAVNANGTVNLGNFSSSIGNLSGTSGGLLQGTGTASSLTVTQTSNGTFAGTLGVTSGNALSFTKNGAANLLLSGTVNPSISFTLTDGGLGLGTKTISSLTQTGGQLLINVGTSTSDLTSITGAYSSNGGGITIQVGSPPTLNAPYTILTYGSFSGTNPPVTINGLSTTRITSNVTYGANNISVSFSGSPASIKWTGAQPSGLWDINNTQNWDNAGSADKYFEFDTVTFDDSATGTTGAVLDVSVSPTAVVFDNDSKNYTLTGTGSIIGIATLTHSGTGSVTLATNNSYSGATTINSGTLQIGNGGTSGTLGTGTVTNDSTLVFNRSDTLTVANAISGIGNLQQAGLGTTILSANNSYSGTTTINTGTLQIGNGGTTGSLGTTSAITNNSNLAFNLSGSLTIALPITGSGAVTQSGSGTTIFDENMPYTGGTTINAGTLQIGNNGTIGSIVGSIVDAGNLSISHSDDIDFSNAVSGSGSLTHNGSGQLRLTGTNTYSGITAISGGGTLLLDSTGSSIPAGTGIAINNGTLDFTDTNLTVSSLSKSTASNASAFAEMGKTLTVQGNVSAKQGRLDLIGVTTFVCDKPAGNFTVGVDTSGQSVSVALADDTTITTASLNIGLNGPSGSGTSSNATLDLGLSTVIHANTIVVGDNAAQSGSSSLTTGISNASVVIRATDGTSRANMIIGSKTNSDYAGGSGSVDFTDSGATLDALLDTLTIGRHSVGSGNFNNATSGSFAFNTGTLDATSIVMAVGQAPNIKTSTGTLTTHGGTIKVGTLTLVQDSGGAIGTATVNLNAGTTLGATLEATTITGQAASNAIINWNEATIANLTGTDLNVTNTTLNLPSGTAPRALAVSGANTATFTGNIINTSFDSATPANLGSFTLTGSLTLSNCTLTVNDTASTPSALTAGTKFVLMDYTAGTLSGTFNGLADGASLTIGANTFIINYDDNSGTAVTLTAQATTTPFEDWLISQGVTPGDPNTLPAEDFDGDDLENMVEYMLNSNPSSGTQTNLPVSNKSGSNLIVTYTRLKAAISAGFTAEIEYSDSLASASWTTATAGMTSVVDNGTTESVTVTIPIPSGADHLFARLKVVEP